MADTPIKVEDVVHLRCGSPPMVVVSLTDTTAEVRWYSEGRILLDNVQLSGLFKSTRSIEENQKIFEGRTR